MRLGIHTRYCASEATYAAIRVAEWAGQYGLDVSLLSATDQSPAVISKWDRRIIDKRLCLFTEWAARCETIVWTHCPLPEQLSWAKRHGIRTIVVAMWHELQPRDIRTLRRADIVIAPSADCGALLYENWRLKNLRIVAWDAGLPRTVKGRLALPTELRLLFPLFDDTAERTEEAVLQLLDNILGLSTGISATVLYTPSRWAPPALRRLKNLALQFGSRLCLVKGPVFPLRPFYYASHDLTVWPTKHEDIGIAGLQSLAMGTPVLAFDVPPISEFLCGRNSVLVPCDLQFSPLKTPSAKPDYPAFEQRLLHVLSRPWEIIALEKQAAATTVSRRLAFEREWAAVVHAPQAS